MDISLRLRALWPLPSLASRIMYLSVQDPGPALLFWNVPIPGWPSWVWKSSGGLPLKSQPQAGGANRRVGHGGHSPAAPLSASILCSTRVCSEDETPQAQGFALFGNILGRPRLEGGKEGVGLGGPQMSRLLHH